MNPSTAVEWAERIRSLIPDTTVWSLVKGRIIENFEGYARQQVEAFRERAVKALPEVPDEDFDGLAYYQECVAAIRALTP